MASLLKGSIVAFALFASLPTSSMSSPFALAADPISFTKFDYFKNTGLDFCSNSSSVQKIAARDPKGGGRGSSSGGGGSRGSSGSSSGSSRKSLIDSSSSAKKSTAYCQKMSGTTVILPATPNQNAFFPWWPTYSMQLGTLVLSYIGLAQSIKVGNRSSKFPIWFWVQLPVDIARIGAWFFKVAHGLVVPHRFAWTSVVLWLLPIAYVCAIFEINGSHKRNSSSSTISTKSQYQPVHQLDPSGYGPMSHEQQGYTHHGYGQQFEPLKQPFINTTPLQPKRKKGASLITGIVLCFIAAIMWCVTVVTLIFHWRTPSISNQRSETYLQDPRVTADPSVLGDLPDACMSFLRSNNLQDQGIYNEHFDQLLSAGFATLQFIIVSLAAFTIVWRVVRRRPTASADNFEKCLTSTIVALILATIGTGVYIGIISWKKNSVAYSYTTDTSVTGGCTFAFVQMDGTFGYWDVPYELGFRIGMSVLGAA